ncbi:nucleotidyltransferase domain protein [bacterium BMS3Abin07]|nr:nucleotidyltransferase domain protein [bacterium BMS3Abin07]
MRQVEKIIDRINAVMPVLREKYSVKTLQIFGSYVRAQQRKRSDIDILVEFSETIDLFTFVELEEFLSEALGIKVDLVMRDTLKPRIKDIILKEALPV